MKTHIVIGAGILGSSTAYHLAKSGENVILIDRQDSGQATDAAAGIICPWLSQRRNKAWYHLAKDGAAYYSQLIRQLEEDGELHTGYKRVGAISIHTEEDKLLKMEERAYKRREHAQEIGDIKRLSSSETKALFPALKDDYSAVYISGAARVNGRALRNSLINAAKKHGATVIYGDASLVTLDQRVVGVKVLEEDIPADSVMITAGAWANELLQPLGIHFLVSPQKAQIAHLHMGETDTSEFPVVMPPNNQYILAFDESKVVIGATHEDNQGYDVRRTAGGLHEILNKALDVAPGLSKCELEEIRVGFRPFTPGFLPVIGGLPKYKGVFLANGLGASGLTIGPYLGAQLAKLAVGYETDIDLTLYDVSQAIEQLGSNTK